VNTQRILETFSDLLVHYGTRTVGVLVLLLVAWQLAGWVYRLVAANLGRTRLDPTLVRFAARLAWWGILLLAVLASLSVFGVETTSFAALIGAIGLTIGLALQGMLGHVAAGIMLVLYRPYKVGDLITVLGQMGRVHEIDLFTTTLDTLDNRRLIIPNGAIFGSTIDNTTYHPHRRVEVRVTVPATAEMERTRDVLLAAARSVSGRLENPAPTVEFQNVSPAGVEWSVFVWAATSALGEVRQSALVGIKGALEKVGIAATGLRF
jgi:small conductance mechanosensitive channel